MDSAKFQISQTDWAIEFLGLIQAVAEHKLANPRSTFWLDFEQVRPLIENKLSGWVMIHWTSEDSPGYYEADGIAEYCLELCEEDNFYFPCEERILNFYLFTKVLPIEDWLVILDYLEKFMNSYPYQDVQFEDMSLKPEEAEECLESGKEYFYPCPIQSKSLH